MLDHRAACESIDVPAVPPHRIVDPTGVGDAFRGGLLKGLARGASYRVCAQIGSVAATYALEHLGGQSHAYTWPEFLERYEQHFGHPAGLYGALVARGTISLPLHPSEVPRRTFIESKTYATSSKRRYVAFAISSIIRYRRLRNAACTALAVRRNRETPRPRIPDRRQPLPFPPGAQSSAPSSAIATGHGLPQRREPGGAQRHGQRRQTAGAGPGADRLLRSTKTACCSTSSSSSPTRCRSISSFSSTPARAWPTRWRSCTRRRSVS